MGPPEIDLTIIRGKTFSFAYLYADDEPIQSLITAMPSRVPLRLTVPSHGLPDGWPFWVSCVKTPCEINSAQYDSLAGFSIHDKMACLMRTSPYWAKVIDDETVEVPGVLASCWKPFSGTDGVLVSRQPVDLTGWQCRAQVRDRADGNLLFTWHSDPDQARDGIAEVDVERSQFILNIDAETSQSLAWRRGIYDVEALAPGGQVYPVTAISNVCVIDEVTR